jgi:hypothetical protein
MYGAWSLLLAHFLCGGVMKVSINPTTMHHKAPVIAGVIAVAPMNANSAVTPDASGSIDATRTNDCVRVLNNERGENGRDKQSGNEEFH